MPARGLINYPRDKNPFAFVFPSAAAAAAVEIEMDTAVQDSQGDSYGRRGRRCDRRYAIKHGAISLHWMEVSSVMGFCAIEV